MLTNTYPAPVNTLSKDKAIAAARIAMGEILTIAVAAVSAAALAGNVTCRKALGEIIVIQDRYNATKNPT